MKVGRVLFWATSLGLGLWFGRPVPSPEPRPKPKPKPKPKPVGQRWKRLKKASLMNALPGRTWLAEADVPWYGEPLVTADKIRAGVREKGLEVVAISEKRPSRWPRKQSDADWFIVVANKGQQTQLVEVPSAVTHVWEVQP